MAQKDGGGGESQRIVSAVLRSGLVDTKAPLDQVSKLELAELQRAGYFWIWENYAIVVKEPEPGPACW